MQSLLPAHLLMILLLASGLIFSLWCAARMGLAALSAMIAPTPANCPYCRAMRVVIAVSGIAAAAASLCLAVTIFFQLPPLIMS